MEKINFKSIENDKATNYNLMPCEIEFTGEAQVNDYFEPSIVLNENGKNYEASFRGRPLMGKNIDLPSEYVISNLKQSLKDEKKYLTNDISTSFKYWNYDLNIDSEDSVNQAIKWLNISEAINKTVKIDEINNFE